MINRTSNALLTDAADQVASMIERLRKNSNRATYSTTIVGSSMDFTMALEHLRDAELRLRVAGSLPEED